MFSFDLENLESVRKFVSKLRLIAHAASLGGVETLVSIPVLASHHGQPEENLTAAGITQGTVRVSVGIENQDDLWADLSQALQD
jgi:cystathionine beta-lyase/cystathionine gamma-synthase